MMAANYRHIGGGENRLGRHYSRFRRFGPPQPLPINHLLCENRRTQGRIGEVGLTWQAHTARMCLFRGVDPTLDRRRIFAYCLIALIVEIVVFLYLIAGTHGLIVPLSKPTSTDFISFYAAGALADAGTPAAGYEPTAHYAAEEDARGGGVG